MDNSSVQRDDNHARTEAYELTFITTISCLVYTVIAIAVIAVQGRGPLYHAIPDLLRGGGGILFLIALALFGTIACVIVATLVKRGFGKWKPAMQRRISTILAFGLYIVFVFVVSGLSFYLAWYLDYSTQSSITSTFWWAIPPSLTLGTLPHINTLGRKIGCIGLSAFLYFIVCAIWLWLLGKNEIGTAFEIWNLNDISFLYIVVFFGGSATDIKTGLVALLEGLTRGLSSCLDGLISILDESREG